MSRNKTSVIRRHSRLTGKAAQLGHPYPPPKLRRGVRRRRKRG